MDATSVARFREAEASLWASAGVSPTEREIELARIGTRVRIQVVGEGAPTVFVHGGPNSGSTWAPLVGHLDGLQCFLLDRPGTGLSPPIGLRADGLVSFAKSLVADVLDGLGIDRAHVVGSSLGGYCALWSAATTPERFDRMVQMACPALLPDQRLPRFMRIMMFPGVRQLITRLPPNEKAGESVMRQLGHGATVDAGLLPTEHADWYLALQRDTDTMRNDFDLISSLKRRGRLDPSVVLGEATLRQVETPTHFIWGAEDPFGGVEVADWIVGLMPDATVEMRAGGGHLPWLDDPSSVASATQQFLLSG